jgi:hypothetical protein
MAFESSAVEALGRLPKLDVHRLYRAGLLPPGTRLVLKAGGQEQTIGLARRPARVIAQRRATETVDLDARLRAIEERIRSNEPNA